MLELFADAAWKVALTSLLLGAGLPALYALGVRASVVGGAGEDTSSGSARTGQPASRALAVLCFLLVLAAVAVGLTVIIATGFGKEVSFEHIFPLIVDKE